MSVTEFALLKLKDSRNNADFVDFIKEVIVTQDAWVGTHQSHLVDSAKAHSTMYLQQSPSDPCLLITAKWDSPEGHEEWIKSKENATCLSTFLTYLAPDPDAVFLFHMTPAGNGRGHLPRDYFAGRLFKVGRVSVVPTEQDELRKDFARLDESMRSSFASSPFWAGWRIEKIDDRQVLVIFWDPLQGERQIQEFLERYQDTDVRSFQEMV